MIGRARRSFLFSIGLLILGFIAIAGALVYRSSRGDAAPEAPAAYAGAPLALPNGAELLSAVATGGTVSVTYRLGPATFVRVFDGNSGQLANEYEILLE